MIYVAGKNFTERYVQNGDDPVDIHRTFKCLPDSSADWQATII